MEVPGQRVNATGSAIQSLNDLKHCRTGGGGQGKMGGGGRKGGEGVGKGGGYT